MRKHMYGSAARGYDEHEHDPGFAPGEMGGTPGVAAGQMLNRYWVGLAPGKSWKALSRYFASWMSRSEMRCSMSQVVR